MLLPSNTYVMGIINVTPDSFSDGGRFNHIDHALKHAERLLEEGAHILDIGGESTRPGAQAVSAEDELKRVMPVLEALKTHFPEALLSVDTCKAEVMQAAIDREVAMINDVMALRAPQALEVCSQATVAVCLMHMQGEPRTMQQKPYYNNVMAEVKAFLLERAAVCEQAGIAQERIWLDPGFGFGKTLEHNVTLLQQLEQLTLTPYPVLVGLSRKSMIGALLGNREVSDRMIGSVVAAAIALLKGAKILRVHDVKETVDALRIAQALL
ncbi:MAG: dihydropteroate synthase [Thiofilum sp.]|uniref:dihydropteroate synthase n=1 Tax=Thiofilum sp. TaxID=2212733 RepID=UPI0025CC9D25|nr:dihydropteroate synthase [Thiofilum sp.]MBK8453540.1 dihydropteroate synthase [Thiofilum sp.]